jgi:hypothetical protein
VLYYRRELFGSVRMFVSAGLVPLLGFVPLAAVFVKAFHDDSQPDFNYSPPLLGVQVPIVIGIGGLLAGAVLMVWAAAAHREFFRRRRETAPQR